MNKRETRRSCFARIREISSEDRVSASKKICESVSKLPEWKEVETVFSYLPLSSEPDLTSLIREFPLKRWGFSRVTEDGKHLCFHHVTSEDHLREGDFGFLEPDPVRCPALDRPDWILIPGIGFCRENLARLGRGKGHYDRFLSGLEGEGIHPQKIGICFETQILSLTPEEHDVAMDKIISEAD